MSLAADWMQMPVVKALGWALVHFLWQGALIALALAAVVPVCRRAQARYGVACVAMLAMLAAFAVTFAVSIPDHGTAVRPGRAMAEAADGGAGSGMAGREPVMLARIQGALPWAVAIWMAGALLMGLYRLGGWMAAQRMRRTGVCAAAAAWQERLSKLAHRIGVSKPLVLLESSLAEAPLVIGYLRPVILVPAGVLAGLPAGQIEAILLHELAHIRRSDYLLNLMQALVESLLFYHPAVWWISGLMRAERENCCDDVVVAVQGEAREYAAALVTMEERRWAGREPALAATGGRLVDRVRRLLSQPEEPRGAAAPVISLGLLLTMFSLFATGQQTNPNSQAEVKPETPYRKWLAEDVAYIIAKEERAAFERLRTGEEREQFIRQFWLRRDPTPGTPANEFKVEHYRRIDYANQRFASAAPGWKTDRGRVYILHGPPDEVESRPGFESWRYRHIDGIGDNVVFEFIDPEHTGEFRLTVAPTAREPGKK